MDRGAWQATVHGVTKSRMCTLIYTIDGVAPPTAPLPCVGFWWGLGIFALMSPFFLKKKNNNYLFTFTFLLYLEASYFLDQESNSCCTAVEAWSLNHWMAEEVPVSPFLLTKSISLLV